MTVGVTPVFLSARRMSMWRWLIALSTRTARQPVVRIRWTIASGEFRMEMSSALAADVCQWGGRIEARSTHLPPQGEDCDEVDEEIIRALREQSHYDALLAERAWF